MQERAEKTLKIAERIGLLLDIALDHLSLGRAHLGLALTVPRPAAPGKEAEADFAKAAEHLDHAVEGLRRAGHEDYLPLGLLARAALRRLRGDLPAAEADLSEALEIAERGSMRLHECDAHLEWARLCRQRGDRDGLERHVARARRLVEETGYGRRRREVEWLERQLGVRAEVLYSGVVQICRPRSPRARSPSRNSPAVGRRRRPGHGEAYPNKSPPSPRATAPRGPGPLPSRPAWSGGYAAETPATSFPQRPGPPARCREYPRRRALTGDEHRRAPAVGLRSGRLAGFAIPLEPPDPRVSSETRGLQHKTPAVGRLTRRFERRSTRGLNDSTGGLQRQDPPVFCLNPRVFETNRRLSYKTTGSNRSTGGFCRSTPGATRGSGSRFPYATVLQRSCCAPGPSALFARGCRVRSPLAGPPPLRGRSPHETLSPPHSYTVWHV